MKHRFLIITLASAALLLLLINMSKGQQQMSFGSDTALANYLGYVSSGGVHIDSVSFCGNDYWLDLSDNRGNIIIGPISHATSIIFDSYHNKFSGNSTVIEVEYSTSPNGSWSLLDSSIVIPYRSCNPITFTTIPLPSAGLYIKIKQKSNSDDLYIDNIKVATGMLPVELSSFYAIPFGDHVQIRWRTETESNCYGFEVQRKKDDGDWEVIKFVQGSGTSNTPVEYSFDDYLDFSKIDRIQYRLKQIDRDLKYKTYDHVLIVHGGVSPWIDISPNVASSSSNVSYFVHDYSKVNISIYDALGRVVVVLEDSYLNKGAYSKNVMTQDMPSGLYFVRMTTPNYQTFKPFRIVK